MIFKTWRVPLIANQHLNMNAFHALIVFLGAGLGGVLRYGVNMTATVIGGMAFPWATLIVNVIGSLLMGCLAQALMMKTQLPSDETIRLFLGTGILGGFTTFSAFSLDSIALWQREETLLMVVYVMASVMLSLLALLAGMVAMRLIFTLP